MKNKFKAGCSLPKKVIFYAGCQNGKGGCSSPSFGGKRKRNKIFIISI